MKTIGVGGSIVLLLTLLPGSSIWGEEVPAPRGELRIVERSVGQNSLHLSGQPPIVSGSGLG